ncbi:MAG: HD domain-containing protein, partial [Negativicutes bacterium]|nr:HD domain-containing protein [Negativicutes bacterium]
VYISPGDHYRMRMTHSLEVSQIARTVARGLGLNEDLVEAVALAHDVGHTPFGHVGEYALREVVGDFCHNGQSLRVVDYIERAGQGLNLTEEVRDGIVNHTGPNQPFTLEGKLVRISDRIAYLCHDYDDGVRAGMLQPSGIPGDVSVVLGTSPSNMITVMVADIIRQSSGRDDIVQSPPVAAAMNLLREFMFENIYHSPKLENDRQKARYIVHKLYEYYMREPARLPAEFLQREEQWGLEMVVVDYIAGLTDHYAVKLFEELYLPRAWVERNI